MLQWLYTYVASVCSKCFSCFRWMLHVFYLGVAYVSHLCCKCFIRMLHMFSHICYICFAMATHVFSLCFRCMLQVFQLFQTYVASVSPRCCKSRYGVAHVVVDPICISRLLQLLGLPACAWVWKGRERQAWETVRAQIEMEWRYPFRFR